MTTPLNGKAPSLRRRIRVFAATALTGAAAVLTLTGCSGLSFQDAVCGGGEYPVLAVGGTGSACVKDGEKVPEGYTRYPGGKVPRKVDDEWDVYWRTHTVDKDGNIVDAPEAG
ncbi:SCO0607 family lipoprotein [Streptomyces sp. NPDC056488]|uniref:SCO0607 family lipoprotein n=1 Tax=Streptomyces sp. NPDC056488 TaxID=3345836 RepID=UPI00368059F8